MFNLTLGIFSDNCKRDFLTGLKLSAKLKLSDCHEWKKNKNDFSSFKFLHNIKKTISADPEQ